jgi:hypothetical protein
LAGEFELAAQHVDSDHAARAGKDSAVYGREADAATTDHDDGRTRFHLGSVNDGADAREDTAADQGRAVQRHVRTNLHNGILMHEHLLGERRQVRELMNQLALQPEPFSLARRQLDVDALAQIGPARDALRAAAAEHRKTGDDVIAFPDVHDIRADRFDHSGRFMSRCIGRRIGIGPVGEMQVGMADAGESGADQDLTRTGLSDLHVLDRDGLVCLPDHGGFHDNTPKD